MFRYNILNMSSSKQEEKETTADGEQPSVEKPTIKRTTVNDRAVLSKRGYLLFNEHLGEGTYSKVKRAYSKYKDSDVAVKIVNRQLAPKDFLNRFFPRELEIIGNIDHPNICRFHEVLDAGTKVYIIMELAPAGDLLDYIKKQKYMPEVQAKKFFSQVLSAMKYLHNKNMLHRDLKCENILLGHKLKPLLADFGFAKHMPNMSEMNRTFCGSSAYAPLEILKGIPYDGQAAEVWSLGCILYIITTGVMPFTDENKSEQIKQMKRGPVYRKAKQGISAELRHLISRMLDVDPKTRITIDEIEQEPWMVAQNKKPTN